MDGAPSWQVSVDRKAVPTPRAAGDHGHLSGRPAAGRDGRARCVGRRIRGWTVAAIAGHAPQLLAGIAAAIPVIESTVRAARAGWVPAGDDGIIATRGWDVLSGHTPLVGQYSEAGLVIHGQVMHSPGPMLYWLIAIPARFGSVTSIAVTMGVVNTLAIITCVALARRRGGLVLMLGTALGIALMSQSLPTEAMHDIWNPAAGLFPFLALIFLSWSVACGEHRLLPGTALVASYVTQTHLMYIAPTAVLLAVGCSGLLAGRLARLRRYRAERRTVAEQVLAEDPDARVPVRDGKARTGQRPARIWPWALAALLVTAACWAPPAIDQADNTPGNLAMIVRTVEHRGPALGATVGWNAVVRSIGARPWWLYVPVSEWQRKVEVRATPSAGEVESAIAILAALALVLAIGSLARRWALVTAAAIGLGLCAAIGLEAASNPAGRLLSETLGYTMWWGSELGLWVWLVLAWALWLGLVAVAKAALPAAHAAAGAVARVLTTGRLLPDSRLHTFWSDPPAPVRALALTLVTLAGTAAVAMAGSAVAHTEKPDSHAYEYASIHKLVAAIERTVQTGQTVDYRFGPLDAGTQPMEPAIRYLLVRHGDRVLARGSYVRLGSYYEYYGQPVQWVLDVRDGTTRPKPRMRLLAEVRFVSPWRKEVVSAWAIREPLPARAQRRLERKRSR